VAFGLGKLAVLESKLDIYEDLSKEMLDKLERAVGTISDNSNKVAIILERHENRLEEGEKANTAIIQMIKDHQKYDDRMFKQLDEKITELDKKTEKNTKFVIGATAVIATVVTVLQVAPPIARLLTQPSVSATMGVVKPL
jgi:histidinol-phosphate/aromatic aminotransferase/cobyric acid decarboxylase-like protein